MGAWAYCSHPGCEQSLERPTLVEMWRSEQRCLNGHLNVPVGDMGESLQELVDKVTKLEADNKRFKRQMARVLGIILEKQ